MNVPLSFFDVLSNVKLPLEILMLPFQVPVEPTSTLPPLTFNVEFFEIVISVSFEIAPFETFMVEDAVPLPIATTSTPYLVISFFTIFAASSFLSCGLVG